MRWAALGVDFEISAGVERSGGAGDQGIMFGYATEETQDFMPAPIHYANKILHNVQKSDRRKQNPAQSNT